jgi:hypothetical protein
MKSVWDHAFFDVLRVDPAAGCRIMLTEPPMNPRQNRRRMLEAMFEGYGFQAAFVQVGGAGLCEARQGWQAKCVWNVWVWVWGCGGGEGRRRRRRGSGRLSLVSVCATREGQECRGLRISVGWRTWDAATGRVLSCLPDIRSCRSAPSLAGAWWMHRLAGSAAGCLPALLAVGRPGHAPLARPAA